jgi:hypothetical protein
MLDMNHRVEDVREQLERHGLLMNEPEPTIIMQQQLHHLLRLTRRAQRLSCLQGEMSGQPSSHARLLPISASP